MKNLDYPLTACPDTESNSWPSLTLQLLFFDSASRKRKTTRHGQACLIRQVVLHKQAHEQAAGVPPTGDEAAVNRFLGSNRVCVKNLRVKLFSEPHDFIFCDGNRTELVHGPFHVVFKITFLRRGAEMSFAHLYFSGRSNIEKIPITKKTLEGTPL